MGQARNLRLLCASVHESLPAVTTSIWFWIAFHIGVFIAIGVDLFTFHRRDRELSITAAARRSVLRVIVALAFELGVLRMCRRVLPITREFHNEHFKVHVDGRWMLTPLALTMIVIEVTDLIFAVDSIPAIFAITRDPFIVYTSNICAILGLRSLYFLLAGLMKRFIYLRTGLALVLGFVGIKMILADYFPSPRAVSLGIIVLILAVTIAISMAKTRNDGAAEGRK